MLLVVILVIQIAIAYPRLSRPLVDGRLHINIDNAGFLLRALHSNDPTIPEWHKVFGVTTYSYDDRNVIVALDHYANHGVLSPLLLRLYARVAGYSESTTSGYSLLLSLGTTVAVFFLLAEATRRYALAFLLTLIYALLPLKYIYLDRWKYEGMVELVIAGCALCLVKRKDGPYFRYGFLAAFFLLFHTDYTAFLPAAVMAGYLLLGLSPGDRRLGIQSVLVGAAGVALTFAIQVSLGFGRQAIGKALSIRTGGSDDGVSIGEWLIRHVVQAGSNLEWWHAALMLAALVVALVLHARLRNPFVFLGGGLIVSTFVYCLVFRDQSYIHHYVSWNYGLGYILLIGGIIATTPALGRVADHVWFLLLLPVVVLTWITASIVEDHYRQAAFGTEADIAVIRSLDRRLLYFDDGLSGEPGWWGSTVIQLYTDPIFRRSRSTGARNITSAGAPSADRDLVVAVRSDKAVAQVSAYLREKFGVDGVRVYRTSPTFVFLTPAPPAK